jgi:SAM-dependent methyltransferase
MNSRMTSNPSTQAPGAVPFDRLADQYDHWFDTGRGSRLFQIELEAIRDLLAGAPRPWLEVGVGTGRTAAALGFDEGVDPCAAALALAKRRGIRVRPGRGEALPFADGSFGVTMLMVTLCFLEEPLLSLKECRRVLQDDGCLIVGFVPRDSRWGRAYLRKGEAGHPFYSVARFYTVREVIRLGEQAGFRMDRANSTLFEAVEGPLAETTTFRAGALRGAGFVALRLSASAPCGGEAVAGS